MSSKKLHKVFRFKAARRLKSRYRTHVKKLRLLFFRKSRSYLKKSGLTAPSRLTKAAVSLLIAILVLGSGGVPRRVEGATYTFVQTDWSGGVSGSTGVHPTNQTGWTVFSTSTTADATSTAGSLKIAGYTGSFSETFTATTYKDTTSTTATWDTGGQISVPSASATDLSSKVSSFTTSTERFSAMVYVPTSGGYFFFGTADGNFARYNTPGYTGGGTYPDADTAYDLTSKISSFWGSQEVYDMVYDSGNSEVYLVGNAEFAKYAPGTDTATDLSSSSGYSSYPAGRAMTFDTTNNRIYIGGATAFNCDTNKVCFLQYNPSNNTITNKSSKVTGLITGNNPISSLEFDSVNTKIYIVAPSANNFFVRYDPGTDADATNLTSAVNCCVGSLIYDLQFVNTGGSQYISLGSDGQHFGRYNIGAGNFTSLESLFESSQNYQQARGVGYDSSANAVYFASSYDDFFRYNITANTITDVSSAISSFWASGTTIYEVHYDSLGNATYIMGDNRLFARYSSPTTANAVSVTVDSTSENIRHATLTKNDTVGSGTVTYYLSNDGGSTWNAVTAGSQYTFSSAGSDLRFKIVVTGNATVQDISISYGGYNSSADLTSSAYNTADSANLITKLAWTATSTSGTETVRFQIRSAPDSGGSPGTWSSWCGYADTGSTCAGSNYFESAQNNTAFASDHPLRNGANDQWLQYKVIFASNSMNTPQLQDVTLTYVVNAPPEFNSTSGLVVTPNASSSDANWGTTAIAYSIRDPDTLSGTATPGYITPSFEYSVNQGGAWTPITTSTLNSTSTDNKGVSQVDYTSYTARWTPASQAVNTYVANAWIRATLNDNEAANNTANATTSFVLDTKKPTSTPTFDGRTNTLSFAGSDDSNLQYKASNLAGLGADSTNASSGIWISPSASSTSASWSWTPTSSTYPLVYVNMADVYGNQTTSTVVVPATPINMNIQDISNVGISEYKEFISWATYSSTSGAAFADTKVYRSTDGSSYSLLGTITASSTNYYVDASLSTSTTYYYKVAVTDTNGDISVYSAVVSDQPNGQGGTDAAPPVISAVTVTSTQSTWATILWTTDELSDSVVEYNASGSSAYGQSASVNSYLTSHSVTLTGLTPSTAYRFRVKSTDPLLNTATDDNSGTGYTFTTSGGPVISNVTAVSVGEQQATIFWNTNTDSSSYVRYSTSSNLANYTETGSASLVGANTSSSLFQHRVNLTGLTSALTYYYAVRSVDGSSNQTLDTNGNNYYTFVTTRDQKAPVISNILTPVLASDAAVIIWTTDEPSTTQVAWGTTSSTYATTTVLNSTLSINHVVALSGLSESTTYHFQARSTDDAGNTGLSSNQTFGTPARSAGVQALVISLSGSNSGTSDIVEDATPPAISGIKVSGISAFGATVTFSTDEDTVGFVEYGRNRNYTATNGSSGFARTHSITLSGLQMGKTYDFRVKAVDRAGKSATGQESAFQTLFFTEPAAISIENISQFQEEVEKALEAALPSLVPPFVSVPEVVGVTEDSATVKWNTNIASFSVVSYAAAGEYDSAKQDPYGLEASDVEHKVTSHELTLSNLKPNTTYHFQAKSYSLPRVIGRSADDTFITKPPKIDPKVGQVLNNGFRIVWTTVQPTTSVVDYENTRTGEGGRASTENFSTFHDVLVENLGSGQTYRVRVSGRTESGNLVEAGTPLSVTTSRDETKPVISLLRIDNALVPGRTDRVQTIVNWKTDEPATSIVYYGEGGGTGRPASVASTSESWVLDHNVILTALKPGALYRIQVASVDEAGNRTEFPIRTIVVPQQSQSVLDVIFKNFEDTFQFLNNVR